MQEEPFRTLQDHRGALSISETDDRHVPRRIVLKKMRAVSFESGDFMGPTRTTGVGLAVAVLLSLFAQGVMSPSSDAMQPTHNQALANCKAKYGKKVAKAIVNKDGSVTCQWRTRPTQQQALAGCKAKYGKKVFNAILNKDGSATCQWRVAREVVPILRGTSEAISLKAFQTKFKLPAPEMKRRFGAAGRIICPWSSGTVFLVERPDVFVTSDHIFIDPARNARFRGNAAKCRLEFFFSGRRYSIKPDSLVHGLKANKTAHLFSWYDWAIGQLDRPVADVEPFAVSPVVPGIGSAVSVISAGMNDATPRVCTGEITTAWGNYSAIDITTTCTVGPGASGGPVVVGPIDLTPKLPLQALALTMGYRPVDADHRNHMALPLSDPATQKALDELLGKLGQVKSE